MPTLSMSALGGKADIPDPRAKCPLMTQSGHWWTWILLAAQIEHYATSTAQTERRKRYWHACRSPMTRLVKKSR